MSKGNILDVSNLSLPGDFYKQVDSILATIRLTREEVENLRNLYWDLEYALQPLWPGCKVIPFGSVVTGLGIKTSDADCFVDIPNKSTLNTADRSIVIKAKNILLRNQNIFQDLFAITAAKVPIVQFKHNPTQMHCDVSFTHKMAVCNSELISYMLQLDKRALHLAILVKYWSQVHKLTGTNLLPNYALVILVIFYLQQVKVLPSVKYLQTLTKEKEILDGWNFSFCSLAGRIPPSDNNRTLPQLLGGFYKYYRDFDFKENIVSPYTGRIMKKSQFQSIKDVPNEFALYKENVGSKTCYPLKIDTNFCVQDPFQHNRNCTVAVYDKLAIVVSAYIHFVANIFESYSNNDFKYFLSDILTKKPEGLPLISSQTRNNRSKPRHARNHMKVTKRYIEPSKVRFPKQIRHVWKNNYNNTLHKRIHPEGVIFRKF